MDPQFIGSYTVGKSIGEGTFGKVKYGTHKNTGQVVAIKILEKARICEPPDIERVKREITILQMLDHPNIVQLYEVFEEEEYIYLVMQYAGGGELFDFIVQNKQIQEALACKFMHQLISGVEYIHSLGVAHRDLKPENLLLTPNLDIIIVDFGLSNTYNQGGTLKTACGSPCYAAPEMIAGREYFGSMTDIWSCGVIMYALLCGYLPFEEADTQLLYRKILTADFHLPRYLSSDAKDLLRNILCIDTTKRFTVQQIQKHNWWNNSKIDLNQSSISKSKRNTIYAKMLPTSIYARCITGYVEEESQIMITQIEPLSLDQSFEYTEISPIQFDVKKKSSVIEQEVDRLLDEVILRTEPNNPKQNNSCLSPAKPVYRQPIQSAGASPLHNMKPVNIQPLQKIQTPSFEQPLKSPRISQKSPTDQGKKSPPIDISKITPIISNGQSKKSNSIDQTHRTDLPLKSPRISQKSSSNSQVQVSPISQKPKPEVLTKFQAVPIPEVVFPTKQIDSPAPPVIEPIPIRHIGKPQSSPMTPQRLTQPNVVRKQPLMTSSGVALPRPLTSKSHRPTDEKEKVQKTQSNKFINKRKELIIRINTRQKPPAPINCQRNLDKMVKHIKPLNLKADDVKLENAAALSAPAKSTADRKVKPEQFQQPYGSTDQDKVNKTQKQQKSLLPTIHSGPYNMTCISSKSINEVMESVTTFLMIQGMEYVRDQQFQITLGELKVSIKRLQNEKMIILIFNQDDSDLIQSLIRNANL